MASPKAILIYSLLTTYLTIINGWRPVGEWNHQHTSLHCRSAEVMWAPQNNVNVRSRRISIYAFFVMGQYAIRKLADVKLFGTRRVRDCKYATMQSLHDCEAKLTVNKENGTSFIYLADVGGNFVSDKRFSIYKFKEARVSPTWNGRNIVIRDFKRICVKFPRHDWPQLATTATMVVDPLNGDILLFTKNNQRQESKVYKVPQGYGDSKTKEFEFVTTLPNTVVTGAEISPDGDILAVTYNGDGGRWWRNPGLVPWADFLKTEIH